MILHITTERNKNDLEWLRSSARVEQVIYDKRNSNLDQFVKTEIRKYAAFDQLLLDSNIFDPEDSDVEEFIRSISYLCTAEIGILGDDVGELDIAAVSWFADAEDRQELLRWLKETNGFMAEEYVHNENKDERVLFFREVGFKILLAGIDEYDQTLALSLANALASWGATVSYSLIAQTEDRLQKLAAEHEALEEIEGGYHLNNVDYYLNAADDDAHFVVFDMERPQINFIKQCHAKKIYYYSHQGLAAMEPLITLLEQTASSAVEILLFGAQDEDHEVIRQQLQNYGVKIHFIASDDARENCMDQEALREKPLEGYFVIGRKVS